MPTKIVRYGSFLDNHFTAPWDGGHIKAWSRETLSGLPTGRARDLRFVGPGYVP